MKFEEKLIQLRKARGLSQEALAEQLGVSRQAVSRWELGETTPDLANLKQLSELYGVSADYLIHDEYESDSDIPKAKEYNIALKLYRTRQLHCYRMLTFFFTVLAICYLIAALILHHNTPIAVGFSITAVLESLFAIFHFIQYLKSKQY